jgi:thiosulfate/3-mercaptopyruvate sulfurtransferase
MNPLVSVDDLRRHLDDPHWIVFDARHDLAAPASGEAAYRQSHVPGARFAHLDRDLSGPKGGGDGRHPLPLRARLAAFFAAQGVHAHDTVVVYDASNGLYASRVWWSLKWLGHANVAVLDGGWPAWMATGAPVTDAVPAPMPGDFAERPSLVAVADTRDVEANLATRARVVVDARAPERYRGEVEPLDPVAGHIPHALNRPMALNMDATGRFKRPEVLRAEFETLLDGRAPDTLIHSCGSGVTACHNRLAMEIAGLPGAAVYPGSWSAWVADPTRPVATGAA